MKFNEISQKIKFYDIIYFFFKFKKKIKNEIYRLTIQIINFIGIFQNITEINNKKKLTIESFEQKSKITVLHFSKIYGFHNSTLLIKILYPKFPHAKLQKDRDNEFSWRLPFPKSFLLLCYSSKEL